jgi:ABC-type amino acid transport substrate-binding protein
MLLPAVVAQEDAGARPAMRYGLNAHLREFPQGSPKETLSSVIQALQKGRVDYLLAQLTDPEFVDDRVKQAYGGKFEDLESESRAKAGDNPAVIKELNRFLKEGEWQVAETTASAQLKDVASSKVYLKKIGDRWFFENRQSAEK